MEFHGSLQSQEDKSNFAENWTNSLLRSIPLDKSFARANAVRTFARMLVHPVGHCLRNSLAGSRRVPSGSFASAKAGVAIPWVTHCEKALVFALECNASVIDYRTYPHVIETVIDGQRIRYMPDAAYDRVDGSVHVVAFKKPKLRVLRAIEDIYAKLGWTFRILDRAGFDIRSDKSRFYSRLLTFKNVEFSKADSLHVQNMLDDGSGKVRIDEVIDQLGGRPIGFAKLCAMHLKRELAIDFDNPPEVPQWISCPPRPSAARCLTFKLWEQRHD